MNEFLAVFVIARGVFNNYVIKFNVPSPLCHQQAYTIVVT